MNKIFDYDLSFINIQYVCSINLNFRMNMNSVMNQNSTAKMFTQEDVRPIFGACFDDDK